MKIESKQSYAIVSTTIRDINNREMRQMHELKNSIKSILSNSPAFCLIMTTINIAFYEIKWGTGGVLTEC